MRVFQTEPEHEERPEYPEHHDINTQLDSLEQRAEMLRRTIGQRRSMLKNAEKTLQQFQDTMYAVLMEDEHFRRKYLAERRKKMQRDAQSSK